MGPDRAASATGAIGEYAADPGPATAFFDADVTVDAADVTGEVPADSDELEAVVERLTDAGLSAYAARTTTRDVEALGFEAVRVVVPAAQPLCFGEMYFGERAAAVPESLGFDARHDRQHHPFP